MDERFEVTASAVRSWQQEGACRGMDPAHFFPERGMSTAEAKQVCADCPVRPQCLAAALEGGERFGIWGGCSERERRTLRRHLARGATMRAVVEQALGRRTEAA